MKQKLPLPPISRSGARPTIDDDDKTLTERKQKLTLDSEEEVVVKLSGQSTGNLITGVDKNWPLLR